MRTANVLQYIACVALVLIVGSCGEDPRKLRGIDGREIVDRLKNKGYAVERIEDGEGMKYRCTRQAKELFDTREQVVVKTLDPDGKDVYELFVERSVFTIYPSMGAFQSEEDSARHAETQRIFFALNDSIQYYLQLPIEGVDLEMQKRKMTGFLFPGFFDGDFEDSGVVYSVVNDIYEHTIWVKVRIYNKMVAKQG